MVGTQSHLRMACPWHSPLDLSPVENLAVWPQCASLRNWRYFGALSFAMIDPSSMSGAQDCAVGQIFLSCPLWPLHITMWHSVPCTDDLERSSCHALLWQPDWYRLGLGNLSSTSAQLSAGAIGLVFGVIDWRPLGRTLLVDNFALNDKILRFLRQFQHTRDSPVPRFPALLLVELARDDKKPPPKVR